VRQELTQNLYTDANGNPAGGETSAKGLNIRWQNGPLVDLASGVRQEPNGCFLETVVRAAIGRLEFYQTAGDRRFACRENAVALTHLETALLWLGKRTAGREERGVEGTHKA
jgi:hypothetical protein